ncbi:ABC transporter permease [Acuticoccus kandeliae]|uniref:ABC transporter permease n=1 Tax=Acuticoccus kandeliae TaxID=2073160 RepID=UPI00196AEC50|nr:ABC transporter permease subunit [Acuticoccus kandeliae]
MAGNIVGMRAKAKKRDGAMSEGRAGTARLVWTVLAAGVSGLVLLPVLAGLAGIVLPAFGYLPALGHEGFGLDVFARLAAAPGLVQSIAVSVISGLGATLIAVLATAAILASAYGTRGLALMERLIAPILSVPHAAAALGFVFLFAPSGFVLRLLSPWATGFTAPPDIALVRDPWGVSLILALAVKEVPFLFLMALAALGQVKARERAAVARVLGYGRVAAFLNAVWPLVYRQLRMPVLAVLAYSASVVDVALILGPTRPAPLGVRVVEWLQAPDLDGWLLGSAGAVAMLAVVAVLVAVWLGGEAAAGWAARRVRLGGWRARRDGVFRYGVLVATVGGVAALFAGFGGLILQSVALYWPFPEAWPEAVSLAAWGRHLPMAGALVGETLAIALGASLLALPLAVVLVEARRHGVRIAGLIYLPLIAPQVAFLFGLSVTAIAVGAVPGRAAVILAHALFVLPYALISLSGPWAALDPRYERVAASLGAPAWRRFARVRLPLMVAPLLVTFALSIAVSVGLYLPTQMIGGGRMETVTTEAVAAATGGDRRLAGIFATLQLLIPFAGFALARAVPAVLYRHRRGLRPVRGLA